jgi:hypothetical protein
VGGPRDGTPFNISGSAFFRVALRIGTKFVGLIVDDRRHWWNKSGGAIDVQAHHVAHVGRSGADLHRGDCRRGRGDAAGVIVDRERHTPRRDQDRGAAVRREDGDAAIS